MPTVQEAFDAAARSRAAGDDPTAERIAREILRVEPHHAPTLHLLGMIAFQHEHIEPALELLRQAVAVEPLRAEYQIDLAGVFEATERFIDALECYERALACKPDDVQLLLRTADVLRRLNRPHHALPHIQRAIELDGGSATSFTSLGITYMQLARPADAAEALHHALKKDPRDADAHGNFGILLRAQGDFDLAVEAFRKAVELRPDFAEGYNNLGNLLSEKEPFRDEAAACLEKAIRLRPDFEQAHFNLGVVRHDQRRFEEALECFQFVASRQTPTADVLNRLGMAYSGMDRLEESFEAYRRALELRPENASILNNLGIALSHGEWHAAAVEAFRRSLASAGDLPTTHWNLSLSLLSLGDLPAGLAEYEWRWKINPLPYRGSSPLWNGDDLQGRTILVWTEQGLGDTLQFVRFLREVRARGAGRIVLKCQSCLIPLLGTFPEQLQLEPFEDEKVLPTHDVHAPLLSLPGMLKTRFDSIPAPIPYLTAQSARMESWRKRLASLPGLRVGIAWQGSLKNPLDSFRSLPLSWFQQLAEVPGVTLISLQKGLGVEQLRSKEMEGRIVELGDFDTDGAFLDTAAIIKNLDLVISADSAIVHLAGALGAPVWNVLGLRPDWRWFLDREDTPWYPTMRLFRLRRGETWQRVQAEIVDALRRAIERR